MANPAPWMDEWIVSWLVGCGHGKRNALVEIPNLVLTKYTIRLPVVLTLVRCLRNHLHDALLLGLTLCHRIPCC